MDQFERQFEHLDVQTQTMEEAMSGVTTLTIPEVSFPSSWPLKHTGPTITHTFCILPRDFSERGSFAKNFFPKLF